MCIHLKATHGDSFSRQFIDCQMVPAVLNMLQNDAKDDVVEIGIWCLSELILADGSILDQVTCVILRCCLQAVTCALMCDFFEM